MYICVFSVAIKYSNCGFINFLTINVSLNIDTFESFTLSLLSDFSKTYLLKHGSVEWS